MAEAAWPTPDYNGRSVNDIEVEVLMNPGAVSGLLGTPSSPPMLFADSSGRQVKLRADRYARVRGRIYWTGTDDVVVPIAANTSGLTRIDKVVLRLDRSTFTVVPHVIAGTPASSPVAPAHTVSTGRTGTWDLPLGNVTVAHNTGANLPTLAAANVTPTAWYVAANGSVLCTKTTRPALGNVSPGVSVYETDTGYGYVMNAAGGLMLNAQDTGQVNITPSSGWGKGSTGVWVRKRNSIVTFYGYFTRTGGAFSSGSVYLCNIPSGYRPPVSLHVPAYLRGSYIGLAGINYSSGNVALGSYKEPTAKGDYVIVPVTSWSTA